MTMDICPQSALECGFMQNIPSCIPGCKDMQVHLPALRPRCTIKVSSAMVHMHFSFWRNSRTCTGDVAAATHKAAPTSAGALGLRAQRRRAVVGDSSPRGRVLVGHHQPAAARQDEQQACDERLVCRHRAPPPRLLSHNGQGQDWNASLQKSTTRISDAKAQNLTSARTVPQAHQRCPEWWRGTLAAPPQGTCRPPQRCCMVQRTIWTCSRV